MNKQSNDEPESHEHDRCDHGCDHHHPMPIKRELPKVGRNEPCLCGSGKKYKKCCG